MLTACRKKRDARQSVRQTWAAGTVAEPVHEKAVRLRTADGRDRIWLSLQRVGQRVACGHNCYALLDTLDRSTFARGANGSQHRVDTCGDFVHL